MLVRSFAKYWVPVIAWVLLIFVMSGDLMSAEHTSRFFVPFLRWIAPEHFSRDNCLAPILPSGKPHTWPNTPFSRCSCVARSFSERTSSGR